jgi:hypothetical protein
MTTHVCPLCGEGPLTHSLILAEFHFYFLDSSVREGCYGRENAGTGYILQSKFQSLVDHGSPYATPYALPFCWNLEPHDQRRSE